VTAAEAERIAAFIRAQTRLVRPPLVPEIGLHLTDAMTPLWEATEAILHRGAVPPPYWAFAWVGGQALARHVLDHGRGPLNGARVLDLASGCGIAAIATVMIGATATATDIDPYAAVAAEINAAANGVRIATSTADLLASGDAAALSYEAVLAGDVCYERPMAERMMALLRACASRGLTVWLADPGRSYLPKDGLEELAHYGVPCTRELEDGEEKTVRIFRVRPAT
jgi:predicted nicotinamide N-methyase